MNFDTSNHLYLVDGSGFIFRAFHALPPFSRPDGTPVGAVLGFSNMLYKLLSQASVDHLAVIFDSARANFRHDLYPDYKANRSETPEELMPQFPLVRAACDAFSVPYLEKNGFEADDLIATLAKQARHKGMQVTIVSSDKDLMQLIEPDVDMYDPMKDKTYGPDEVMEKFGVLPDRVIDVQALAGDSSDNIPGVPGIGIKTAATLIQEFGDLETLLLKASTIKQPKRRQSLIDHQEAARLSKQLVTLKDDVPLEVEPASFKRRLPDPDQLTQFLLDQNFKTLLNRLQKNGLAAEGAGPKTPSPSTTPLSVITPHYTLIQDEGNLIDWVKKIKAKGLFSFDTETTGLDPHQADLVGISLAIAPGQACYIPLQHRSHDIKEDLFKAPQQQDIRQLPLQTVLSHLLPLFQDEGLLKIAHNAKYDLLILRRYGLSLGPVDDTMVMSYALDGALHSHGLDKLALMHLDHTMISFEEVAGKGKDQITFDLLPLDTALAYAAEDADMTLRLYHLFRQRLLDEKLLRVYETIDKPLIPVLCHMELIGVKVDPLQLKDLSRVFEKKLTQLESQIHDLAGHSFNVASPQQLATVLFEELNLPTPKKGKSGTYSTGIDVLESLALEEHEIAQHIIEWRQFAKLKSTYSDALLKEINPHTNRVHTSFAMTITSTGRLSSRNPNLQNIPIRTEEGRKIRQAFVAEPSNKLISLDYSQIELRLLAHMADIPTLKDAFLNNLDIHTQTASDVFGLPLDQVDSEHRRRAKAINFGIIYGISPFGLARQLNIAREEAAHYIKAYQEKYPGILAFMDNIKEQARAQGYVETLMGRRCHITGLHHKNPAQRAFAERQAINAPLQGTAADIIKCAMIQTARFLKQSALDASLLLQVHDELLLEVKEVDAQTTAKEIQKIMESVMSLSVPLSVDYGIADSWDQAH